MTTMVEFETPLWEQGLFHVCGIDEVGRGCLFGDVVAAAVILPPGQIIVGVDDSKKLSEKKRNLLYNLIMEQALAVGVARVDAQTIDRINIKQAARLAMKQAVQSLSVRPDYLLVDAERVDSELPQQAIIHGDARSQSIAAASIIAKVTRDRLCAEWDAQYPQYALTQHKGYGTALHRALLLEHGPCALHRRTFIRKIFTVSD